MKGKFFIALTAAMLISLGLGSFVYASIDISKIKLLGDDSFINEVLSESKAIDELYVSTEGNDNNDGSLEKPFRTINKGLEEAKAGTTVYVRGGEYTEYVYIPQSGKENAYISLKNYKNENPIIKGNGKNDTALIDLDGHDYIRIEGFEICESTAKWAYGINLAGGENHIIIKNNKIHDIKCSNPNNPDNSGANGILLFGETKEPISNVYIGENELYNLVTGWCEALSVTANCEYINVINNYVHNCTNIGIDFYGNNADDYCPVEELNQPRYCIAAGNEVSQCVCDYADCYGIYVDGARDIIVESNISHHNMGGIEIGSEERNENYPVKNIIVRNNALYNNSVSGITVGGWNDGSSKGDAVSGVVYDTKIINNTSRNNGKQLVISMINGIEIANNIFDGDFIECMQNKEVVKNITFNNNIYYNNGNFKGYFVDFETSDFNEWKNKYDQNGIYTNPGFADDTYILSKSSNAIDKGINADYGSFDVKGNSRVSGNAADIGALEYQKETQDVVVLKGDANADNLINEEDVKAILERVRNADYYLKAYEFTENIIDIIDIDGDSIVTATDSATLKNKLANPK